MSASYATVKVWGWQWILWVRCGECNRYDTHLERLLKYFTDKMIDDKVYDTDGRKRSAKKCDLTKGGCNPSMQKRNSMM